MRVLNQLKSFNQLLLSNFSKKKKKNYSATWRVLNKTEKMFDYYSIS